VLRIHAVSTIFHAFKLLYGAISGLGEFLHLCLQGADAVATALKRRTDFILEEIDLSEVGQ
jgi:hypothetical protein